MTYLFLTLFYRFGFLYTVLSVRFEVGVSLLLAPAGAGKKGRRRTQLEPSYL